MSVAAPARRLLSSAASQSIHARACRHALCVSLPLRTVHHQQRRSASQKGSDEPGSSNPILEEYRKNNPELPAQQAGSPPAQGMPKQGDIAASSIFEDDRRIELQRRGDGPEQEAGDGLTRAGGVLRNPTSIARVIHPDPNARERWERKKVIQMIKSGGRLSKAQFIKRTEREHAVKSHNMKTSVKKLGMIARQIAGKTIDDAIVQMRFSQKKIAQEVLKQLEAARDEAIVMRGMGLGKVATSNEAEMLNQSSSNDAKAPPPVQIQLKDGKRHKVEDRSTIYIDQAWVGRGPYGSLPDYRARGRIYTMRTPWTSLSVVLKEEATRIREHTEREAKRRKRITDKVWVPHPDRPITTNRQWYSW